LKTKIRKLVFSTITAILIVLMVSFVGVTAPVPPHPNLIINGRTISGSGAFIENGVTYVPLRVVSEALGAEVSWDPDAYAVQINLQTANDDKTVSDVIQNISPSVVAIVGNFGNDRIAHGTGVIIRSGGWILTNAHVVDGLRNILVILHDGTTWNGRVRYSDSGSDLAVVQIDRIGLPIVTFADIETVVPGETAVAIGTPLSFSLRNSASRGIVSGLNRGLMGGTNEYALIQTDASINSGNSGGPLVNLRGEVMGINSSKFMGVGIEGVGFAIPSDTVMFVLNQFERYGEVRRANIEATFEESWAARHGFPTQDGLTVRSSQGITREQGLVAGDIIMSINNTPVHSTIDFNEVMKRCSRGDTAEFLIQRGENELTLLLTLV